MRPCTLSPHALDIQHITKPAPKDQEKYKNKIKII